MSTAIKHPVPDLLKPLFVIFDIRALFRAERQSARISKITNNYNYKMATVGVKGLKRPIVDVAGSAR